MKTPEKEAYTAALRHAVANACDAAFRKGDTWAYVSDTPETVNQGDLRAAISLDISYVYFTSSETFNRVGFTRHAAKEL